MLELGLELTGFDEAPHLPALERAEAAGFRFFPLAEAGDDETTRQRLYPLVRQGVVDAPQRDDVPDFEDYAAFCEQLYYPRYWWPRAGVWLVADDEVWVGLSQVTLENGTARCGLTVVARPYRRRRLALPLKLMALRWARSQGATHAVTRNDRRNRAMRAVNRQLGFRPLQEREGTR